ncbi:MAG: hypothetical protein VX225_05765 [Pseudomonadota bacterium]|nr:hypothetical protein [Pseudomonadota bacterium]
MKVFVSWALARRYRLIVLAVAFAPIIPVIATALIALETIKRGNLQGSYSAALSILGVLLLAFVSGAGVQFAGALGVATLVTGVGVGCLVRWSRSMALAFQAIVLLCLLGVLGSGVLWPDPSAAFDPLIENFVETLSSSGATEEQINVIQGWQPMLLGVLFVTLFFQLSGALLLAFYWLAFTEGGWSFGEQFRSLRLGRVLGWPATLVIGLGMAFNVLLVQNLIPLALACFLFQGLSVLHTWSKLRQWHPVVLGVLYLLMITPLTGVVMLLLSSVGLLDNWINMRALMRPR